MARSRFQLPSPDTRLNLLPIQHRMNVAWLQARYTGEILFEESCNKEVCPEYIRMIAKYSENCISENCENATSMDNPKENQPDPTRTNKTQNQQNPTRSDRRIALPTRKYWQRWSHFLRNIAFPLAYRVVLCTWRRVIFAFISSWLFQLLKAVGVVSTVHCLAVYWVVFTLC